MIEKDNRRDKGPAGIRSAHEEVITIHEVTKGNSFTLLGGEEMPTLCFLLQGRVLVDDGRGQEFLVIGGEMFALLPKRRFQCRALEDDSLMVACRLDVKTWASLCGYVGPSLVMGLGEARFRRLAIHPLLAGEIMLYVRCYWDGKLSLGKYQYLKREQILLLLREIYPPTPLASLFR